jgi:hypothetical protein
MLLGTAFTLFFVPAIYVLLARDHRKAQQDTDLTATEGQDAADAPASLEAAS